MAALIEAIDVKRKMVFEFEGTPYYCLEVEVSTPTARGGQTLVRLKMRNLLTRAVFDKTFKAGEKFKEPDLEMVESSYLYSDSEPTATTMVSASTISTELARKTDVSSTNVALFTSSSPHLTSSSPQLPGPEGHSTHHSRLGGQTRVGARRRRCGPAG